MGDFQKGDKIRVKGFEATIEGDPYAGSMATTQVRATNPDDGGLAGNHLVFLDSPIVERVAPATPEIKLGQVWKTGIGTDRYWLVVKNPAGKIGLVPETDVSNFQSADHFFKQRPSATKFSER